MGQAMVSLSKTTSSDSNLDNNSTSVYFIIWDDLSAIAHMWPHKETCHNIFNITVQFQLPLKNVSIFLD